jgi:antitoxin VapB
VPIQIANPAVVARIEELAARTGLGKTGAVSAAVDRMLGELAAGPRDPWTGLHAIVAQMRRVPARPDAFEAVPYDEAGLPR